MLVNNECDGMNGIKRTGLSNKDWEKLIIYMIEYEWFSI